MKLTKLSKFFLGAALVLGPAYYFLFRANESTDDCAFKLDATELRRLAESIPGDKATTVRLERVAAFEMPDAIVVTGHPWSLTRMPVYSYQLLFPGSSIVIDTGMSAEQTDQMQGVDFEPQAYQRISKAMGKASSIYVTHEHADHWGGLLAQTGTTAFARAKITAEQLANPEALAPVVMPPDVPAKLTAFHYDRIQAVAPGVVLIKAPGHTPGSQLIFVQRQDGTELLILGDTAWHADNITEIRPPAPVVTYAFLHNDRSAHACQLAALHQLAESEPKILQIPGHDGGVIEKLLAQGALAQTFE